MRNRLPTAVVAQGYIIERNKKRLYPVTLVVRLLIMKKFLYRSTSLRENLALRGSLTLRARFVRDRLFFQIFSVYQDGADEI